MKLGIHTESTNRRFQKSLRRINGQVEELRKRLADIDLPGRYGNVMMTFFDENPSVLRVTRRGKADNIYEVDVGYDFAAGYPPEDDVLVIQLIEEKLKQVLEDDGFEVKRTEVLQVITDRTTGAIGA